MPEPSLHLRKTKGCFQISAAEEVIKTSEIITIRQTVLTIPKMTMDSHNGLFKAVG